MTAFSKKWFLPVWLLAFTLTCLAGTETGGGGDPWEIDAEVYPDEVGLDQAIYSAITAVEKSALPENFKNDVIHEMNSLKLAEKFKLLPALIILNSGTGPGAYRPVDSHRFVSLGAMTNLEPGATVYLAKRVLKYSTTELAKIILHEVIHHVTPKGLSNDEEFVAELVDSIIKNENNERHIRALTIGGDFNETKFSLISFLEISKLVPKMMVYVKLRYKDKNDPAWKEWEDKLMNKLVKHFPSNLAEMPIQEFVNDLYEKILPGSQPNNLHSVSPMSVTPNLFYEVDVTLKKINHDLDLNESGSWACRKKTYQIPFLDRCKRSDQILFKDIFSNQ